MIEYIEIKGGNFKNLNIENLKVERGSLYLLTSPENSIADFLLPNIPNEISGGVLNSSVKSKGILNVGDYFNSGNVDLQLFKTLSSKFKIEPVNPVKNYLTAFKTAVMTSYLQNDLLLVNPVGLSFQSLSELIYFLLSLFENNPTKTGIIVLDNIAGLKYAYSFQSIEREQLDQIERLLNSKELTI